MGPSSSFRGWHGALVVLGALLALCALRPVLQSTPLETCTIFTVVSDETVLFGNNEDWHSPDPLVGFRPASLTDFGSIHVGFRHSDGSIEFAGAMNDHGLSWDVNSVPYSPLNPHPEKPFSHATDNYLSTITKKAASVADAIQIAGQFEFGDGMSLQIHVADATGDGVVIGAGPDGEVAFTRKAPGDGYLVSTNFNLAELDSATVDWRYEKAASMLAELGPSQPLAAEYAGEILNAVHLNNLTTYTLYSNVFDLRNGSIYLYYMSQYDEVVELNLADELSKGERIVEMRDLFSADTVDAGEAAYRWFEIRFTLAKVVVIGVVLAIIGAPVIFLVRRKKRRSVVEG